MGKKDKEFGSQVNLIECSNDITKTGVPVENHPPHQNSLKRSTRQNSFEFDTVRPEQKVLTADEKVRSSTFFSGLDIKAKNTKGPFK